MPEIKTKHKSQPVLNTAQQQMQRSFVRAKQEQAAHRQSERSESPSNYAEENVSRTAEDAVRDDWLREQFRAEPIDELVEIMLEVAMNRSPTIRIGRDAGYPTSYVQERFSKITAMHIERVMEGIADNRTQVRNTRAYLLASLFNSVSTLDNQCTMQYNYNLGGSW